MSVMMPLAVTVAMIGAAPASAHWQYTRWGMTPQQVIDASNGTVHPGEGPDDLEGTYSADGRVFDASFRFVGGRLTMVTLLSRIPAICETAVNDLVALYGSPDRRDIGTNGIGAAQWSDYAKMNAIILTSIPPTCTIDYMVLPDPATSGL